MPLAWFAPKSTSKGYVAMFARYKKSMLRITGLLRSLEASLDDVTQLLALQRDLVQCIVRAERRILVTQARRRDLQRQLKAGRPSKLESKKLRHRIAALDDQISMSQQLMFIWRCFGDGIAFSYLDKFALKHAFFNTHDLERKQRAGAVSGKEGFHNELKVVMALLCSKRLPAMLSDITNIIRHGDVCLLGGPDPFPRLSRVRTAMPASIDKWPTWGPCTLSTRTIPRRTFVAFPGKSAGKSSRHLR
jgi:hypothetical protein